MNESAPTPTGSRFALGVLVALLVLSPWPFGSAHPVTRWLIAVVCLGTAIAILLLRIRRKERVEIPAAAALGAGVFLLGLAQLIPLPPAVHSLLAPGSAAIWHPDVPAAAKVLGSGPRPISIWPEATRLAAALGLGLISLATLAMPALRDRRRAIRAAAIVVGSALAVAVYGLVARLVFGDRLFGVLAVPTVAPFGSFVSKNHFAGYVEMGALLAVGLAWELASRPRPTMGPFGWMEGPRAGRIVLAFAAAITLCLAVFVSLSRGGVVSLVAGAAGFAIMRLYTRQESPSRGRARAWAVATLLAGTSVILLVVPHEARSRLWTIADGRGDAATEYRLAVWQDSTRLITSSPLTGHGLGSFVDALPRFKTGAGDLLIEHAENDYLEILAETGLIGMGLACAALLAFVRSARRDRDDGRRGTVPALAQGASAGLIAIGVHSVVDFNFRIPSNALLFAYLAIVVAASRHFRRVRGRGVLCLILLCALAVASSHPGPKALPLDLGRLVGLERAGESPTPLRLQDTKERLRNHLVERPAGAEAWLWLAWTMSSSGLPREGSALAAYAVSLDPLRGRLGEAASRLER